MNFGILLLNYSEILVIYLSDKLISEEYPIWQISAMTINDIIHR